MLVTAIGHKRKAGAEATRTAAERGQASSLRFVARHRFVRTGKAGDGLGIMPCVTLGRMSAIRDQLGWPRWRQGRDPDFRFGTCRTDAEALALTAIHSADLTGGFELGRQRFGAMVARSLRSLSTKHIIPKIGRSDIEDLRLRDIQDATVHRSGTRAFVAEKAFNLDGIVFTKGK